MQAPRVGVYTGEQLGAYGYAEKPWFLPHVRLHAFVEELGRRGLDARVSMLPAPRADDADLLRFHTAEHVARVRRLCAANAGALDHGPTFARASVETAATHVVGAVAYATRGLLAGDLDRAFVPIAGFHHAHRAEARNYCLYNDVAIAVALLLDQGVTPVAYVDIDAHHGDGVYDAFATDPRVLIADVHQDGRTLWPFSPESPGTEPVTGERAHRGHGAAEGTKLNIPLQPGSTDEHLRTAFDEIEAFLAPRAPSFVVFESGADCLAGDPLASLSFTTDSLAHATRRLAQLAKRTARGRMLVLGGGGYDLTQIGRAWCTVVEALLEP